MDFTTVAVLAALFGGTLLGAGLASFIFGLMWADHTQAWHKPPR